MKKAYQILLIICLLCFSGYAIYWIRERPITPEMIPFVIEESTEDISIIVNCVGNDCKIDCISANCTITIEEAN